MERVTSLFLFMAAAIVSSYVRKRETVVDLCANNAFRLEGRLHSFPLHTVVVLLLRYIVSESVEN
jgi:hypothetical protein